MKWRGQPETETDTFSRSQVHSVELSGLFAGHIAVLDFVTGFATANVQKIRKSIYSLLMILKNLIFVHLQNIKIILSIQSRVTFQYTLYSSTTTTASCCAWKNASFIHHYLLRNLHFICTKIKMLVAFFALIHLHVKWIYSRRHNNYPQSDLIHDDDDEQGGDVAGEDIIMTTTAEPTNLMNRFLYFSPKISFCPSWNPTTTAEPILQPLPGPQRRTTNTVVDLWSKLRCWWWVSSSSFSDSVQRFVCMFSAALTLEKLFRTGSHAKQCV